MSKVTDIVSEMARPIVEKYDCELWDVEYVREGGTWYLRIYIDRADGVSIQHCEDISRELDPALDRLDPIKESYVLEVSSAGLERALRRPSDFQRFLGSQVSVSLYGPVEGSKEHVGRLVSYDDGRVAIDAFGRELVFEPGQVALVRLRAEF